MKRLVQLWIAIILLALFAAPPAFAQGTTTRIFLPVAVKDYDPTWQFQAPVKVQLSPIPYSTPYLIVDSSGRPHLLWDTYYGEKAFIYHTYLTEQGWTTPTPIAQTLGRSKLLNPPAAGSHNDIYLVWYNELNIGGPSRILYAAWDGAQWGPEYELLGNGKSGAINGMVRLDAQGVPNVAYIDSYWLANGEDFYQKWTGAGFSPRQQITPPSYSSLVWLDSNSGIRFYGDDYNGKLHYGYWKGGSFVVTDQILTGEIGSRLSVLDSLNNLHLIRSGSVPVPGGNVDGLYHQCLKSSLDWTPEQVLTGQEDIINYSVSYNNLIQPVIAWSKNNSQTITVTFWNGCNLAKQREITLPALQNSTGWGNFVTVSENTQAGKVCLVSKEKYQSYTIWVTCTQR